LPKFNDDLMVAKVFTCCLRRSRTVGEITRSIYGNGYAKNQVRVFQVLEVLIGEGVIVPKVNGGSLRFQIDRDLVKGMVN